MTECEMMSAGVEVLLRVTGIDNATAAASGCLSVSRGRSAVLAELRIK